METIDIQNRCFVVRWVKCEKGDTINYQVKPLKKSIQLGIYKKLKNDVEGHATAVHIAPDTRTMLDYTSRTLLQRNSSIYSGSNSSKSTTSPKGPRSRQDSSNSIAHTADSKKRGNSSSNLSIADIQQQTQDLPLKEKLIASGFTLVESMGTVHGNQFKQGVIEVKDDDYYYAFILDNSSSKNAKKKLLFNASIVKTDAQSITGKKVGYSSTSLTSKTINGLNKGSASQLSMNGQNGKSCHNKSNNSVMRVGQGRYLQGYLLKKRRKRLQGFRKRFFTLDYRYGTLSYYLNDHNQTCRGEMVINLSTVSANKKDRIIIIDSGMELWFMKASDTNTWQTWVDALQSCFELTEPIPEDDENIDEDEHTIGPTSSKINDRNVSAEADNLQTPRPRLGESSAPASTRSTDYTPLPDSVYNEYTGNLMLIQEWIEKCKLESLRYVPVRNEFNLGSELSEKEKKTEMYLAGINSPINTASTDSLENIHEDTPTSHSLYRKLSEMETFMGQFIKQSKLLLRDHQLISRQVKENRYSIISSVSDNEEYFDARDGLTQGVILLDDAEDDSGDTEYSKDEPEIGVDDLEDDEYDSEDLDMRHHTTNEYSSTESLLLNEKTKTIESSVPETMSRRGSVPMIETTLYPFPIVKDIVRRSDIKPSTSTPPSLLSFLRKNVGKDLSSITMPVTSNEPLSILQVISEAFEYADILHPKRDMQPLTSVAIFAISALSIQRDKTRALRKPFNPLLGETFEYIHERYGFRLIAEKVSHKPQIFAFNVEHPQWTCEYTMTPVQKFWGKSLELNNEGTIKLTLKKTGVVYKWVQPTTMVKNLIAGERYTEPVNEFEIEGSDGSKAKVTFQKTGMFGGRSESLSVSISPSKGSKWKKQTLKGKWTESLEDASTHKKLWHVGDLVKNSQSKYGFTTFTAHLNEITDIEKNELPPTDSRLRPDIQAYEIGDLEKAEELKLKLEQLQRDRRLNNKDVVPKYFEKVSNTEWKIIEGPNNYWERRKRKDWSGIEDLW
ncbi:oxysterol-binding protein related protein OSH3 RNJ42_02693 [Nakaseomyces bracarensis]|uniref:oxysterol-binding protein related protein OSH3 n=1 Tax=Nakaseomyces bracarensis TaxID=273131 RepID=UPI0038719FB7